MACFKGTNILSFQLSISQVERVKDTDPTVKTGDSNEEEVENKPSFKDLKSFLVWYHFPFSMYFVRDMGK